MRVKNPKQGYWSDELFKRAIEFHGHGGPFMVVGLRMGLIALKRLEAKGWFDVRCHVELMWRPPESCVIDGIQCSTGCTMGKRNIEVSEKEGIAAEFTKGEKSIRIALKGDVLARMWRAEAKEELHSLIEELIAANPSDLFEVQ